MRSPRARTLTLLAALAAAAALPACQSPRERLAERKLELRDVLDRAYAAYGGGSLANQARTDAERKGEGEEGEAGRTAARFLGEMDRGYFEGYCLAVGRGERPFNLSGKLEAFMQAEENVAACRKAAKLDGEIRELEAKVGG